MQIWGIFKYGKAKNCFINGSFWEIYFPIMIFLIIIYKFVVENGITPKHCKYEFSKKFKF